MLLAAKLLSNVEVSADVSNQHEINATILRKALELPEGATSGILEITYLDAEDGLPDTESSQYTMYNSRKGKSRSAEYRLYYYSTHLQQRARVGDVVIVLRSSDHPDLKMLVVPQIHPLGTDLAATLSQEGVELGTRFQRIQTRISESSFRHLLAGLGDFTPIPDSEIIIRAMSPRFIDKVLTGRLMPPTKDMAIEAQRIFADLWPGSIDVDAQLHWTLHVETAIFQRLERDLGQVELDALTVDGRVPFDAAVTMIMSRLQARKSRRGNSLQHHFIALLRRERITYSAQAYTEGKEKPDFLFPSGEAYHDSSFPPERLRMVACKSVIRERWRQVLKEADRIPVKYLLTLDSGLTDDTLAAMTEARLEVFMPALTADEVYAERVGRRYIASVAHLVEQLRLSQY